jgi:hypothetical protein
MNAIKDRHGKTVQIGTRVRIVELSGQWFDDLPAEERDDLLSMIGEVFRVESIDDYGCPVVMKIWTEEGGYRAHDIALASNEMEVAE